MNENSQQCPFCQQANHCGIANPNRCWCMMATMPDGLLALLPQSSQPKVSASCICSTCVDFYRRDAAAFKQRYQLS